MVITLATNYTFTLSKIFWLLPPSVASINISQMYIILPLLTNLQ